MAKNDNGKYAWKELRYGTYNYYVVETGKIVATVTRSGMGYDTSEPHTVSLESSHTQSKINIGVAIVAEVEGDYINLGSAKKAVEKHFSDLDAQLSNFSESFDKAQKKWKDDLEDKPVYRPRIIPLTPSDINPIPQNDPTDWPYPQNYPKEWLGGKE